MVKVMKAKPFASNTYEVNKPLKDIQQVNTVILLNIVFYLNI